MNTLTQKLTELARRAQANGSYYSLDYGKRILDAIKAEFGTTSHISDYGTRRVEVLSLSSECGAWGIRILVDHTEECTWVMTLGVVPEDAPEVALPSYFSEVFDVLYADDFQWHGGYIDFKHDAFPEFVSARYDHYLHTVFSTNRIRMTYGFKPLEPMTMEEACLTL